MTLKEIQAHVGTTPDGIFGPKTSAALRAARYEVVLDSGHTMDQTREYPYQWPASAWKDVEFLRAARQLGFSDVTHDSVEHMLNAKICKACAAALAGKHRVLWYDDPAKANKAEYIEAAKVANACGPRVFVSVHANGSLGVKKYLTNTACGTVSFFRAGSSAGGKLAQRLTESVLDLRRISDGPNNRADKAVATTAYHVLNAANSGMASALVEVGFYDHRADLLWMCAHTEDIGRALAAAIHNYLEP